MPKKGYEESKDEYDEYFEEEKRSSGFNMVIDGANFSRQEIEFIKYVDDFKNKNHIVYPTVVDMFRLAKEFLKIGE